MIIVIDSYNVLKQAFYKTEISRVIKDHFIVQLGLYAKNKKHTIIAVFDGEDERYALRDTIRGITLIHSGHGQTADDWIKRYIASNKGYDLLLISTDRALGAAVKKLGVESMDSMDFYALLAQSRDGSQMATAHGAADLVKLSEHDNFDLDALMQQAANNVPYKTDDTMMPRKSPNRTLSKKERAIHKKLKKL